MPPSEGARRGQYIYSRTCQDTPTQKMIVYLNVYIQWLIISIPIDSDARVMWDQQTGRSRGFGFVSFRNQQVSFYLHLVYIVFWIMHDFVPI